MHHVHIWGIASRVQWQKKSSFQRIQSLGLEDPIEKEMATFSSILAWETPWTEGAWRDIVLVVAKESDMT